MARIILLGIILSLALSAVSYPQENLPDSILIGNPDRSHIIAGIGQKAGLPVWIKTDDSVVFMSFSIATSDEHILSRDNGVFFLPIYQWPNTDFIPPDFNHPSPGLTSQEIICVANSDSLYLEAKRCLNTHYKWQHIADYFVTIVSD